VNAVPSGDMIGHSACIARGFLSSFGASVRQSESIDENLGAPPARWQALKRYTVFNAQEEHHM
jgi:hypothetical protein